jgi:hypothetical protein
LVRAGRGVATSIKSPLALLLSFNISDPDTIG